MPHESRRRWFHIAYSLRTLFVVVTLVAVWLGYHLHWIRERHEIRQWLEQRWVMSGSFEVGGTRPKLPWSLRALGEKPEQVLVFGRDPAFDDEHDFQTRVERAQSLFPEARVLEF